MVEVILDREAFEADDFGAVVAESDKEVAVFTPVGLKVFVVAVYLLHELGSHGKV